MSLEDQNASRAVVCWAERLEAKSARVRAARGRVLIMFVLIGAQRNRIRNQNLFDIRARLQIQPEGGVFGQNAVRPEGRCARSESQSTESEHRPAEGGALPHRNLRCLRA